MQHRTTIWMKRDAGFGLVEIMVGLVIGMLAAIVILQVAALSEARKRTTTGGGDAQTNGAIMFYQLQRDISQAGYGLNSTGLFHCNAVWSISGTDIATPIPLAPVTINPPTTIIPAGDANTDTLLVMYGTADVEPQGVTVTGQASNVYAVSMAGPFSVGDRVIAQPDSCTSNLRLDTVTDTDASDTSSGTHVTMGASAAANALFDLGPAPKILAYRVRQGTLTVCDYLTNDCGLATNKDDLSVWVPIASNIVSMRALYLRDTASPMDGIADTTDQTSPSSACEVAKISGIDLVLVARNAQYEKAIVTTTAQNTSGKTNAPTWAGDALSTPVPLSLGSDTQADEPWKHYRYKTFESVIPIRNLAWMGVVTGC